MDTFYYIQQFHNKSHIEVGDGFISVHTEKKSEVLNYEGKPILELSNEEYCISAQNGFFLICNNKSNDFYILNKAKEIIVSIKTHNLLVSRFRNIIVYYDNKIDSVCIVDYAGRTLFVLNNGFTSSFQTAYQISHYILCLEFKPLFEEREFNRKYYKNKCIVFNIPNKEILVQGESVEGYDKTVITDVSYFELPTILPNKNGNPWSSNNIKQKIQTQFIPVIKYTVVEPCFDNDDNVIYKRHVEFCDFCGNIVKRTEYSEISELQDGFYIVKKDASYNYDFSYLSNNLYYGLLNSHFEPFLPCCFPQFIREGKTIKIEVSSWSDWLSIELDFSSKRFIAKNKNGESILLPYEYCSCNNEYIPNTNNKLLFAYKYNENGEYCTGIISATGEELLAAKYESIYKISDNLYKALDFSQNCYLLYIEKNKIIMRKQYLKIEPDSQKDFFRVRVYDDKDTSSHIKLGIIDQTGIEIIPPIYDYIFPPREGKVSYIKNGLAGWINLSDMSMHEYPKYSVIKPFINDLSIVCVGDVCVRSVSTHTVGMDSNPYSPYYGEFEEDDLYGDLIIRFKYENHKEGMIDIHGQIIVEPIYEEIRRINNVDNLILIKDTNKWGAINNHGNIVIPINYNWFSTDIYNDYDEYKDAVCKMGDEKNIYFYDSNGKLLGTEPTRQYYYDAYEHDEYDYERDTFYALGGYDYDEWRNNGGNLDDMMDNMGL